MSLRPNFSVLKRPRAQMSRAQLSGTHTLAMPLLLNRGAQLIAHNVHN